MRSASPSSNKCFTNGGYPRIRYRYPGPRNRIVDRILPMSGPVDLTIPLWLRASVMLKPVAQAPIENALMVTNGSDPKQYRAKKLMLRWAMWRSASERIQLYGVPVDPLDSSIVVPANGIRP